MSSTIVSSSGRQTSMITPPSEAGILEGITRKFVVTELAPLVGVEVTQKNMRIEEAFESALQPPISKRHCRPCLLRKSPSSRTDLVTIRPGFSRA